MRDWRPLRLRLLAIALPALGVSAMALAAGPASQPATAPATSPSSSAPATDLALARRVDALVRDAQYATTRDLTRFQDEMGLAQFRARTASGLEKTRYEELVKTQQAWRKVLVAAVAHDMVWTDPEAVSRARAAATDMVNSEERARAAQGTPQGDELAKEVVALRAQVETATGYNRKLWMT